jgi:AcrR family transcriptional regulator
MPTRRKNVIAPERIVDAVMARAEKIGWSQVRLFDVADQLGIGLAELRQHYRDLDAVADAWLARADRAMLAARERPGFTKLAPRERIRRALLAFLGALSTHRRVTGEIFRAKLYFGHPHHNIALILWVSRTVQWWREAANLGNDNRRRRIEEIGLTALFVATIVFWLRDDSPSQEHTAEFLDARLAQAERAIGRYFSA